MHLFLPTSFTTYTESTSQLIFKLFLIFSNPENFRKLIFQSALRISSLVGICAIKSNYIFSRWTWRLWPWPSTWPPTEETLRKEPPKKRPIKRRHLLSSLHPKYNFSRLFISSQRSMCSFSRVFIMGSFTSSSVRGMDSGVSCSEHFNIRFFLQFITFFP